ncbi:hypothetical protein [Paenibacillus spongiae]|uniref:WD40 repeat domain-containing protein n=1 Tax=Paenibacillus spongiae TaxID=2909671 RepID=A0ABY5S8T7_9BACL|nr:hypothetical protein [Paenibacillus spongiae]UVI29247.1 hypothetical protein L1F29_28070 [Paenibacillus spongiae]
MTRSGRKPARELPRVGLLLLLTGTIIAAYWGIGDGFLWFTSRDRTILLDSETPVAGKPDDFRIVSAVKRQSDDLLSGARLLGDDKLLFFSQSGENKKRTGISTLSLKDNTIEEVVRSSRIIEASASPDGTKLVYLVYDEVALFTVWYDLTERRELDRLIGAANMLTMLDASRLIEMFEESIRLLDMKTGESRVIWKWTKATTDKPFRLKVSPDRKRVYFQVTDGDGRSTSIRFAALDGSESIQLAVGDINDFVPLSGGRLLVTGRINGSEGLFLISGERFDRIVQLKKGFMTNLTVDAAQKKIAYVVRSSEGRPVLTAATLNASAGLSAETTVYSDPGTVTMLQWNGEGTTLVCVALGLGGDEVYQFRFST